jgi:hypothetical protein
VGLWLMICFFSIFCHHKRKYKSDEFFNILCFMTFIFEYCFSSNNGELLILCMCYLHYDSATYIQISAPAALLKKLVFTLQTQFSISFVPTFHGTNIPCVVCTACVCALVAGCGRAAYVCDVRVYGIYRIQIEEIF